MNRKYRLSSATIWNVALLFDKFFQRDLALRCLLDKFGRHGVCYRQQNFLLSRNFWIVVLDIDCDVFQF